MLDQWQTKEIIRCQADKIYLAENYGWMSHPAPSLNFPIRFIPWDWQKVLVTLWSMGLSTIVLKSRQLGFSWTIAWFVNAVINFEPGAEILLLSSKEEKAIDLLSKVTFFYDHLPSWLRAPTVERSKTRFGVQIRYYDEAAGGWRWATSSVSSLTTTGTSGAGRSARSVFIDEFALMGESGRKGMDEAAYAAVAPTTIHGGQLAIGSTPRGYGGAFHRVWIETVSPLINAGIADDLMPHREWNRNILASIGQMEDLYVVPIKAHYSMCYHDSEWIDKATYKLSGSRARRVQEHFSEIVYDSVWRDNQARRLKLSKPKMLQEFELYFDQPGNPAFNSEDLQACYRPLRDPWVQKQIQMSESFFIGVDSAVGISKTNIEPDYHAITALNDRGVQVDALHHRKPLSDWAGSTQKDPRTGQNIELKGDVLKFMERYRPNETVVEDNGPGQVVINRIMPHIPHDCRLSTQNMSHAVKPKLVSDMQIALQERRICITDYFTFQTMMQYTVVAPGKFEASPGFYDDPVVALLWALYLMNIHGAYHIQWGADESDARLVGVTPEEDVSPEKLRDLDATPGPDIASHVPQMPGQRMNQRMGELLPFTAEERHPRWEREKRPRWNRNGRRKVLRR